MNDWYIVANADEIPSPALLVYPDRIEENLRRMIAMAGGVDRLRPHVKTHKMAPIIAMKRAMGIDKFKTSTIAESEMTAAAGGRDVLLAYQCVGPNADRLATLVKRFPETRFSSLVDDAASLTHIAASATRLGVSINLFIDVNVGMNRTGIECGDRAIDLYQRIEAIEGVRPAGLHIYDGHLHESDDAVLRSKAEEAFEPVWAMIRKLKARGLSVPTVVASGTPTSAILATHAMDAGTHLEVSAGTMVLWDHGQRTITPNLDYLNAAVLLARVISRPGENRVCVDVGHKSVASEMPLPRVHWLGLADARAVIHSEEHMVLETSQAPSLPVGTVIYGIPLHVCPTVALHHEAWVVRDGHAVQRWPVIARDRRLTI